MKLIVLLLCLIPSLALAEVRITFKDGTVSCDNYAIKGNQYCRSIGGIQACGDKADIQSIVKVNSCDEEDSNSQRVIGTQNTPKQMTTDDLERRYGRGSTSSASAGVSDSSGKPAFLKAQAEQVCHEAVLNTSYSTSGVNEFNTICSDRVNGRIPCNYSCVVTDAILNNTDWSDNYGSFWYETKCEGIGVGKISKPMRCSIRLSGKRWIYEVK